MVNSYQRGIEPSLRRCRRGFTIIELLLIITVVALLAIVSLVAYNGVQERTAAAMVKNTLSSAHDALQSYRTENHSYPSNIADTEYAPPANVAVALFTDAEQIPVYSELSNDQNAQLFLNTCNGYMPVEDGSQTYNTLCVYDGNNLHVKGTVSSNVVIDGPTIEDGDVVLKCGTACETAQSAIIATFQAQGGRFPVRVISKGATLPAPVITTSGQAARYCLEGRSSQFANVLFHIESTGPSLEDGACPADSELHYP